MELFLGLGMRARHARRELEQWGERRVVELESEQCLFERQG